MKATTFLALMTSLVPLWHVTLGCHHGLLFGRRKRGLLAASTEAYFPNCFSNRLPSPTIPRTWQSSVHFTIFHTKWYKDRIPEKCQTKVGVELANCWLDELAKYVYSSSEVFPASQNCTASYFNLIFAGTHSYPGTFNPNPTSSPVNRQSASCLPINETDFVNRIVASVNPSQLDSNDDTLVNFQDVVNAAKYDIICDGCSCADIPDSHSYNSSDGLHCNGCWIWRILTSLDKDSPLFGPILQYALDHAGLQKLALADC